MSDEWTSDDYIQDVNDSMRKNADYLRGVGSQEGFGDEWDVYDDNDEPAICPACEGFTTYAERQAIARCWTDINNADEQGVAITVIYWYCADCDHRWHTEHGRPLGVDCDCD